MLVFQSEVHIPSGLPIKTTRGGWDSLSTSRLKLSTVAWEAGRAGRGSNFSYFCPMLIFISIYFRKKRFLLFPYFILFWTVCELTRVSTRVGHNSRELRAPALFE